MELEMKKMTYKQQGKREGRKNEDKGGSLCQAVPLKIQRLLD